MDDSPEEIDEWLYRTVGYAISITWTGRTGKIVREETDQVEIMAHNAAQRLWEQAREECKPGMNLGKVVIRNVIRWASDRLDQAEGA
jgi:hypothetical protein